VLVIAGIGIGAFFIGQGSRMSGEEVDAKLAAQAADDKKFYGDRQRDALTRQRRQLTARADHRATQAERRGYDKGMTQGQEQGYATGQSAGYNSGKAAGEEEGYAEGQADGYMSGFDEGTCYTTDYVYVC
jgi:hypothetical protein